MAMVFCKRLTSEDSRTLLVNTFAHGLRVDTLPKFAQSFCAVLILGVPDDSLLCLHVTHFDRH